MSGSKSVAVNGGGGNGYTAPFTAVQWQELEHQALIYKYLVAGVPVPSYLVLPIRRSLEALSARLLQHHALGYTNLSLYYGKKFDPEPGRCRRTDGKKWRCSKEAFHESKYCERHMNRGRNRSRKPVESQSTAKGSYQNVITTSTATATAKSLSPITTNSGSYNGSKLQLDTLQYGIEDLRYAQEQTVTVNVDNQNYASGVGVGVGVATNLWCGVSNGNGNCWSSQVVTSSSSLLSDPQNDSYSNTFEHVMNDDANNSISISSSSSSSSKQQHFCFFGSEIDQVNHDEAELHNSLLPNPWSNLIA